MERQLRDNIGFEGTPLRLLWRGKPPSDRLRPDRTQQGSAGADAA
jgi:GTP-binding protein